MSINLCVKKYSGTWTRRFGDHENAGFGVAINDQSAHVTLTEVGIKFEIDCEDVPAAWATPIDVVQLRHELVQTIVRRMTPEVLEAIFGEIHRLCQQARWAGEGAIQLKIREAIGLC